MAIYLDDQTGPMLKNLLKKEIARLPSNFVAERLLKMVEGDDERKATIRSCSHSFNEMVGHRETCRKCFSTKDGFESWSNKGNGERTTHQSKDYGNTAPTIPTQPDQA